MIALLDTHLLLWAAGGSKRLPAEVFEYLDDPFSEPMFSVVSIWEIAIKSGKGREDFTIDPGVLRTELLRNGYGEIDIVGPDAAMVAHLPPIHRDPFDRMLVAQARVKGIELWTADMAVAQYGPPVRLVR